jgi:hypothetical protein
MKLLLISAAALAAALLGGCTTYTTPGYSSYGTRVYSDGYNSGDHYGRAYRDDGEGYYGRGSYDGGTYYGGSQSEYDRHRSSTVVVQERNTAVSRDKSSRALTSHQASATVSHGHGNKAAVSQKATNQPQTAHGGGKHPRSDKTPKPTKKTE